MTGLSLCISRIKPHLWLYGHSVCTLILWQPSMCQGLIHDGHLSCLCWALFPTPHSSMIKFHPWWSFAAVIIWTLVPPQPFVQNWQMMLNCCNLCIKSFSDLSADLIHDTQLHTPSPHRYVANIIHDDLSLESLSIYSLPYSPVPKPDP